MQSEISLPSGDNLMPIWHFIGIIFTYVTVIEELAFLDSKTVGSILSENIDNVKVVK